MLESDAQRGRPLPSPGLSWVPGRIPMASHFGDVYYSRDGGLDEARHVFLDGCGLPAAWQGGETFTVCELGFGTGLNFLATWDAWRRARIRNARLHYIAVEGFPLLQSELSETLLEWPELRTLVRGLMRVYPQPQRGFHRIFPKITGDDQSSSIILTLLFGEVAAMLSQLEAEVDAWFLDGFAPDKNPEMWREDIFTQIARLSHTKEGGSRLATYTAAGEVRRRLDTAGFDTTKTAGFGERREMLRARFRGNVSAKTLLQPWFAQPPSSHGTRGHAAIIGGGVAGASTAFALNRRGWSTTIIERHETLAAETSGNPMGIMVPRLAAGDALDGRFYGAAWRFVLDILEELSDTSSTLLRDRCGALQLATDDAEVARQNSIANASTLPEPLLFLVGAKEASDIAGCRLPYSALYFPQGGWLRPREFCTALAQNSNTLLGVDAAALSHSGGLWEVADSTGYVHTRADVVVLANGLGAGAVPYTAWLPLVARRGQISITPPTNMSTALRAVLSFGAYITPPHRGAHYIGATFDTADATETHTEIQSRADDDVRNIAAINKILPEMLYEERTISPHHRAAIRCTSPDHLPVAGPVPDQGAYLRDFAEMRHGHPWAKYPEAAYQAGLYVLSALGSRGLTSAPLAGEILAAHITGEPWPLERDLMTALHPARFLLRDLKRREV
jgi:tRNA 5-methylaminomethyl-2-thiouridine biosynthesis bifunctional protein